MDIRRWNLPIPHMMHAEEQRRTDRDTRRHQNAGQKSTSHKVSGTLAGTEKIKQRKDCYDKNKD